MVDGRNVERMATALLPPEPIRAWRDLVDRPEAGRRNGRQRPRTDPAIGTPVQEAG